MQPRSRASRVERITRLEHGTQANGGVNVVIRSGGQSDEDAIDAYCRDHAMERHRATFIVLTELDAGI